jgi:hypothetical protein
VLGTVVVGEGGHAGEGRGRSRTLTKPEGTSRNVEHRDSSIARCWHTLTTAVWQSRTGEAGATWCQQGTATPERHTFKAVAGPTHGQG